MKCYKVKRPDCGNGWCLFHKFPEIESEFDGAEIGDQIIVEMVEMTQKELDELPEFEGW